MLETSRLILRPFEERDYADVYEYTNRQTVHCFADMHFKSPEAARQEMRRRREDADFYLGTRAQGGSMLTPRTTTFPRRGYARSSACEGKGCFWNM